MVNLFSRSKIYFWTHSICGSSTLSLCWQHLQDNWPLLFIGSAGWLAGWLFLTNCSTIDGQKPLGNCVSQARRSQAKHNSLSILNSFQSQCIITDIHWECGTRHQTGETEMARWPPAMGYATLINKPVPVLRAPLRATVAVAVSESQSKSQSPAAICKLSIICRHGFPETNFHSCSRRSVCCSNVLEFNFICY